MKFRWSMSGAVLPAKTGAVASARVPRVGVLGAAGSRLGAADRVCRAGKADHDLSLLNGVAALVGGRAGIHGVLVIYAPADGVYLDDLQTHGGWWVR